MMPWRRHRRSTSALRPREQADAWQLVSLLLDYPDAVLVGRLPQLRAVAAELPERVGAPLVGFCDDLAAGDLWAWQQEYVDTFDVTRKCALHLTYFLHGDTRKRGVALVQFKQAYRAAGVPDEEVDGLGELPDHLCVVLELGAGIDADAAWKLLNDHRVGIELLHRALVGKESRWLPVVQALRATLPELQGDDHEALARLIAQGPPQEAVGIDDAPYALDPALDEHLAAPTLAPSAGCGGSSTQADLGRSIPIGAPR